MVPGYQRAIQYPASQPKRPRPAVQAWGSGPAHPPTRSSGSSEAPTHTHPRFLCGFYFLIPSARSSLTPPAPLLAAPLPSALASKLRTNERASLSARATSHANCRLYPASSSSPVPISSPSPWPRSRWPINFSTRELAPPGPLHPPRRRRLQSGERTESPLHPSYWFHLQFV
jgi:hypothetical protein